MSVETESASAEVDCDIDPGASDELSSCSGSASTSTLTLTNTNGELDAYFLVEYSINGGTSYLEKVGNQIVSANGSATLTQSVSEGFTIKWRYKSSSSSGSFSGGYTALDESSTVSCTTTTTTLPENLFIFEPLISTNRVCDEDGGAMFGITVDNTRSNVDAEVIQRVWVDKFTVFEKQETIPAGQFIQFSSFEISEDKFFTVEFEVTNVKNNNKQTMVKNKTSDWLDNGISPTD